MIISSLDLEMIDCSKIYTPEEFTLLLVSALERQLPYINWHLKDFRLCKNDFECAIELDLYTYDSIIGWLRYCGYKQETVRVIFSIDGFPMRGLQTKIIQCVEDIFTSIGH